jgi:hypothetical protein
MMECWNHGIMRKARRQNSEARAPEVSHLSQGFGAAGADSMKSLIGDQ